MKKYEFTGKTMRFEGKTLHEIRALKDLHIPAMSPYVEDINIRKGDIGGWIQSEDNLSHGGNCWVDHTAKVHGDSSIKDNAYIGNEATVCDCTIAGNARVYDNADVSGGSVVFGNALIYGHAVVKDRSKAYDNAEIMGNAFVFRSEIYGGAAVTGAARVCCRKLCKAIYYSTNSFRDELPQCRGKKYEFTGKTIQYDGYTLHQIRALKDLCILSTRSQTNNIHIHAGDIGGWICSENALSHEGNCWVDHNAMVYGASPSVRDDAYVGNEATVCGATIADNARVIGNADVSGFTNVFGNALIGESAVVKNRSKIHGNVTIMGTATVVNSDIYGYTTIEGAINVACKTLNKGLYDSEDDFREKVPESRSYEKPFIPVDNSLSYYEKMADERNRIEWHMGMIRAGM